MDTATLLHECRRRGLAFERDGEDLAVFGPSPAITPAILLALQADINAIEGALSQDLAPKYDHFGPTGPSLVQEKVGFGPVKNSMNEGLFFTIGPNGPRKKQVGNGEEGFFLGGSSSGLELNKDQGTYLPTQNLGPFGPNATQPLVVIEINDGPMALNDGPSVGPHDDFGPEIWILHDLRSAVAFWPTERWLAWRRRSQELQPERPTAEEIREADHAAYLEIAGREIPTDANPGTDETDETPARSSLHRGPRRPGFVRFLDLCYANDIALSVESGRIHADGDRGLMTPDFFAALASHEPKLIAALESFSPRPETAP